MYGLLFSSFLISENDIFCFFLIFIAKPVCHLAAICFIVCYCSIPLCRSSIVLRKYIVVYSFKYNILSNIDSNQYKI